MGCDLSRMATSGQGYSHIPPDLSRMATFGGGYAEVRHRHDTDLLLPRVGRQLTGNEPRCSTSRDTGRVTRRGGLASLLQTCQRASSRARPGCMWVEVCQRASSRARPGCIPAPSLPTREFTREAWVHVGRSLPKSKFTREACAHPCSEFAKEQVHARGPWPAHALKSAMMRLIRGREPKSAIVTPEM